MTPKNSIKRASHRAANASELPVYDSIGQCSGATKIPRSVLQSAKKEGCTAFVGSRVSLGPLLAWIFSKGDPDTDGNWKGRWEKAKALREELRLQEDQERLLSRDTVSDATSRCLSILFTELDRVFCCQFPAEAKGRTELEVKAAAERAIETMKSTARETIKAITNDDAA